MALEVASLPHLNALVNALVVVLLLRGYWHIRHGRRRGILGSATSDAENCCGRDRQDDGPGP